jgi:zinc protease
MLEPKMKTQVQEEASTKSNPGSRKKSSRVRFIHGFTAFASIIMCAAFFMWSPSATGVGTTPNQRQRVVRATLQNGLRVVMVQNRLAPVATTIVNYLAGSNEAPEGFPGMAHAQEHMMFRGSPGLSAGQLANITAAMGGMFDADTQQAVTQYFLSVPVEDLDVALHIEAIRMRGVLDSEALWSRERGAIEQEVAQDLSDPQYVFYTRLLTDMFRGTAYAHDALGTTHSFNKTTGAMLKKFYDEWYAPNNAILAIAGDIDPRRTLDQVRKLFGGIPSKKLPVRPGFLFETVVPKTIKLKTDLPYGLAVIAFRMPGYDNKDYAAAQLAADALNSPRGDLNKLAVEGKTLFTGFNIDFMQKAGLGYAVSGFPKGGDPSTVLNEMRATLNHMLTKGIPEGLIEAAKRHETADAEFQKNSVFGTAMAWSQALAIEGRESPDDDINAFKKASPSDVNRVLRDYIRLDKTVTAVLTPEESGKPVSSSKFGGRESFSIGQSRGVKLPSWAEKALKRIRIPKSGLNPTVSILPNGIRLIVQPAYVSDSVSVYGHIRNNPLLQTPPGKEGVDSVLDGLFPYGTTTLDRLAFQKALDDIGANASAGTDFSLQVLTKHLDRGVQLLADNELRPALPEEAFEIIRKQTAEKVAGQIQSPDYLTGRALKKALYPAHDPALRRPLPATVSALSLEDVREYYRSVFRPDMTIIVVIGNITPAGAKTAIEKYFGGWRARGPKPNVLLPPVPSNRQTAIAVPDTSRVQDKVVLAQTIGLTRSNPDYYALNLGNHVLGGGFYATRLYRDLREKTGLVYYVSSSFQVGRTRSLYMVEYACDPSNVSRARTLVERNLKEMRTAAVKPDALRLAKSMLLREMPLEESSLRHVAQGFITRSVLDLPLNEPTLAAHRYVRLTADQVRRAFARWIRPADLVQVTEGPAPH